MTNKLRKEMQRNVSLDKNLQCVVMGKTKDFGLFGFGLGWFLFAFVFFRVSGLYMDKEGK